VKAYSRWQAAVVLLASLAAALGTARLGIWQLDRAAQKTALHEAIVARGDLPPLTIEELATRPEQVAAQEHRRVQLEGRWLVQHHIYLDNRQMDGRPGFYLVTPLLLADGDAVLVQRGWLPRNNRDRTQLAPVKTPQGRVRIDARITPCPARLYEFKAAASGAIRQNLDIAAYAQETGLRLRPLALLQLDSAAGPADGLQRRWLQAAPDVSKHHGYALQWFSLSALVTGLYVWFQLIQPRRRPR